MKEFENSLEERAYYGKKSSIVCIILNVLLSAFKGIVGVISGSISILADAFNNLTDASSNIISLLAFKLSGKPADKDHPYGHGRYEYLASFIISVLILVVGVELIKESVTKIFNPQIIDFSIFVVIVLVVSILVKLWMMFYNIKMGKKINSDTLIATGLDSRNDIIATSLVLVSTLIFYFFELNIDGYMGSLVAIFIIYSGFGLLKDTLDPLLGKAPDKEIVDLIKNKIKKYDNVLGSHDLIVHDYGPGRLFASIHVEMSDKINPNISHEIIDKIEKDFWDEDKLRVVIHYDPISVGDEFVSQLKIGINDIVKEIDNSMSIHDLRIVKGENNTNVIFDCVVPLDIKISKDELNDIICKKVYEKYKKVTCVITFDDSYIG